MGRFKQVRNRLMSILFWSIVSAAFIGPGTVTAGAQAGVAFQFDLSWSFVFATIGCLMLQEASARVTIASGMNLGQAIARQFEGKSTESLILLLIISSIVIGCAAYESGNIMGAMSGLKLIFPNQSKYVLIAGLGIVAFLALSFKSIRYIANFLGSLVMLMGIAFVIIAIGIKPNWSEVLSGSVTPAMPTGSWLLVLGLIGTTIVPYDLFLGSGVMEKKQTMSEMRFGLSVAVILGGLISIAVLIVGTVIYQEFSFTSLAQTLTSSLGPNAVVLFGLGLFAASLATTMTSPLAAALTSQSLFEKRNPKKWATQSTYFKITWMSVLSFGLLFGLSGIEPIPVIIIVQALNGLILPLVSIFLLFVVNDRRFMGEYVNGPIANIIMAVIVCVTMIMGTILMIQQLSDLWQFAQNKGVTSFLAISLGCVLLTIWLMRLVYRERKRSEAQSGAYQKHAPQETEAKTE